MRHIQVKKVENIRKDLYMSLIQEAAELNKAKGGILKAESGFLSKLSSPARNALVHEGIDTLQELSKYTEKEILKIHGIGPASLPMMRTSLEEEGLSFKG